MKSLSELSIIENDLYKYKRSTHYSLNVVTRQYLDDVITKCIEDITADKANVNKGIKDLEKDCTSASFLDGLSSDDEILKYLQEYIHASVTKEQLLGVLTQKKTCLDKIPDVKSTKKSGQISSNEFNKLLGNPVFEYKGDSFFNKSERSRTKSLSYVVKYNNSKNDYSICYKSSSEVTNVYTLYDFFHNEKFIHYIDGKETLTTLGINVLSLYSFPSSNGIPCKDRCKTDLIYVPDESKSSMVAFNDEKIGYTSYFVFNNMLLKSFMDLMVNLGFGDILFTYFLSAINFFSKLSSDSIYKHLYFTDKKLNKNERLLLKSRRIGSIAFSSDFYFRKEVVFNFMKLSIECICEVYPEFDVADLMRRVTFYGGHDFVAQGDDLDNYFRTASKKYVEPKPECKVDNFVKYNTETCSASHKPKRIRLSDDRNNSVVVRISDLKRSTKKGGFSSIDVILTVLERLNTTWGIPIKDLCSKKSYLLSEDCIITTPSRTGAHIDLRNGTYYVINKNTGWENLNTALDVLFKQLNDFNITLEYSFENN